MTDTTPDVSDGTPLASLASVPPTPNRARWGLALLVAALGAWLFLNYALIEFEYPPELRAVDDFSPQHLQEAAEAKNAEIRWKLSMLKFSLVGLSLGLVPLFAATLPLDSRQSRAIVVGIVVGLIAGLVVAHLGLAARQFLRIDGPYAQWGAEGEHVLEGDTLVFALLSVVLVLPVAVTTWLRSRDGGLQRAVAILVAGLAAGAAVPLVVSLAFPAQQTAQFPPEGVPLTATWFVLLAVLMFVFSSMIGESQPKPVPPGEPASSSAS